MAKKTTKTTTKNTKKGTVTKTVTKSSKKGLIIGITVGALALAGAGVGGYFIWKSFQKDEPTPTTKKATFELDKDTPKLYGHLVDSKGSEITTVDLTSKIGKELKEETFYFMPLKDKKDIDFSVTIDKGDKFTAVYSKSAEPEKPGEIKVTSVNHYKLKDKDKLVATFSVPKPPEDTWTLSLDSDSTKYGDLDFKGQRGKSITVESFIGEKEATIYFIPEEEYEDTKFDVTAEDADQNELTASYSLDTGIVTLTKTEGTFLAGDKITLYFDEPKVATIKLSSTEYGTFDGADELDISEYIDQPSFTVGFTLATSDYEDFTVTITSSHSTTFTGVYIPSSTSITISAIEQGTVVQDGDVFEIELTPIEGEKIATLKLANDSINYGDFTYTEDLETKTSTYINISDDCVGKTDFEIPFTPASTYESTQFSDIRVTSSGGETVKASYEVEEGNGVFKMNCNPALKERSNLTLNFDVPSYTVTLNSADEGDFTGGDVITISDVKEGTLLGDLFNQGDYYPNCATTGRSFDYYTYTNTEGKTDGERAYNDEAIYHNVNLVANYDYDLMHFTNVSDKPFAFELYVGWVFQTKPELLYTTDSTPDSETSTWLDATDAGGYVTLQPGEEIYFKGNNPNGFYEYVEGRSPSEVNAQFWKQSGTEGYVAVGGNIMSLIDDGKCEATEIPADHAFFGLFAFQHFPIVTAPELPAVALKDHAYNELFAGCDKLRNGPRELMATNIPDHCYTAMFNGCSSLKTAPKMPNISYDVTCAGSSYSGMFQSTGLVNGPAFPAKTSYDFTYWMTFYNCQNLISVGPIGATSGGDRSFYEMFENCSNLKIMPDISSITTVDQQAFNQMFKGCSNLCVTKDFSPDLSTTGSQVFYLMFENCSSLMVAPKLPNLESKSQMYEGMFRGCEKLERVEVNYGTAGEITWPSFGTSYWLENAGTNTIHTPTFVWNGATTGFEDSWRTSSHIPAGWNVENPA